MIDRIITVHDSIPRGGVRVRRQEKRRKGRTKVERSKKENEKGKDNKKIAETTSSL